MQQTFFWTGQSYQDVAIVASLFFTVLVLLPALQWRSFYRLGLQSLLLGSEHLYQKEYKKRGDFSRMTLFSALLSSGQFAFATLLVLQEKDLFLSATLTDLLFYFVLLFIGGVFLFLIDFLRFSLLGYIFIQRDARRKWITSYQVSLWQLPLLFCIGTFLLLGYNSFSWGLYFLIAVYGLWRLFLAIRSFGTFELSYSRFSLFFLYLCTCEVVPIALLIEVLLLRK